MKDVVLYLLLLFLLQEVRSPLDQVPSANDPHEHDALAQHLREQAGAEKGLLSQLAASTAVHLEQGSAYALLPRPWLASWRTYVGASGKRSSMADVVRPGALPDAVAETFCACHAFQAEQPEQPAHLNVPPPSVVKRYISPASETFCIWYALQTEQPVPPTCVVDGALLSAIMHIAAC